MAQTFIAGVESYCAGTLVAVDGSVLCLHELSIMLIDSALERIHCRTAHLWHCNYFDIHVKLLGITQFYISQFRRHDSTSSLFHFDCLGGHQLRIGNVISCAARISD